MECFGERRGAQKAVVNSGFFVGERVVYMFSLRGVGEGRTGLSPKQSWTALDFAFEVSCRNFFFPECVAKGSRLTLGGLGVEPCSRPVVSMFATVRNRPQPSATVCNRPQPFATVRGRALRRCHWGKLLQVTIHGCVTCQFAPLFHCDLHEKDMSRKQRDAFRCTGAAFCEIRSLLRSSIGISVWRVVFLGCWMWPCHWDLRFRVWHRSSVFVTSLS